MQTTTAEQPARRSRTRLSEKLKQAIRDTSTALSTTDWDYVLDMLEMAFWMVVLTATLVIPIAITYVFSEATMSETRVPIICVLCHFAILLWFYHSEWACAYVEPSSIISFDDIKTYWDSFSTIKAMITIAAVEIAMPITIWSTVCWMNNWTFESFVFPSFIMLGIRYILAVLPAEEARTRQIAAHRAQCDGNCAWCRDYERKQLVKEIKSEIYWSAWMWHNSRQSTNKRCRAR